MSAPFEGVEAVFFDVDDTLYDFTQSMRHAFEHLHEVFPDVFAQYQIDQVEDAYWQYYEGVPEARKVELINTDPDLFRRTMWTGTLVNLGHEEHARSASGAAATLTGAAGLDALARRVTDEMQRVRPGHWRRAMYEGAPELLLDLKPRFTLGAITNGPSPVQRPKLQALDYLRYFEEPRVFVSGEFGTRKPDPSIFLAAAKAAGADPRACVMIGDAREFDMPAKAVGFRTVLFTGPRDVPDVAKDEWPPDAVASSYYDIRKLLLG